MDANRCFLIRADASRSMAWSTCSRTKWRRTSPDIGTGLDTHVAEQVAGHEGLGAREKSVLPKGNCRQ